MSLDLSLLDNPIWNALNTIHQEYSAGTAEIRRYQRDIIPFMGMKGADISLLSHIEPYFKLNEEIFIKGDFQSVPSNWTIINTLTCVQMVYLKTVSQTPGTEGVIKLTVNDAEELSQLVNLVQPGFFKPGTSLLGDYYGIRSAGKLVAVTGERFRLKGFTELSAVCTHPDHTGKGYAQTLLHTVCTKNTDQGNIPFLHVVDSNTRAIKIYEHLQFEKRMDFPLLKLRYTGNNAGI